MHVGPGQGYVDSNKTYMSSSVRNILKPRQDGCRFPGDIFNWIFLNENSWIFIKISLKFVPKGPINNIPAMVQIMGWHRPGDKPFSEPMMISSLTHICVIRPQWVNTLRRAHSGHLAGDLFKCIFWNAILRIWIQISQKFVPNCPTAVCIIAWYRTGDKPLPEPMST